MSRFANPQATGRFVLGPCDCTGTPHAEGDWLALRIELGSQDLIALEAFMADESTDAAYQALKFMLKDWNLLGDDGKVAPLTDEYIGRLYLDTFPAIREWINANVKMASLPNASAAPSRGSSRGSGSRTRRALTDGSSTTPSWPAEVPTGTSGTPPPSS